MESVETAPVAFAGSATGRTRTSLTGDAATAALAAPGHLLGRGSLKPLETVSVEGILPWMINLDFLEARKQKGKG
jgi:hypothetical protein